MDAKALHEYIWQGISKEVYADGIELHLPFFFGNSSDEPLCLTWDRKGVLSDVGRTIAELERRVGSIQPYMDAICEILSQCGDCKLIGGRIIVKEHFQTVISGEKQYPDYLGGMNRMLEAIARISILGTVPMGEDRAVLV